MSSLLKILLGVTVGLLVGGFGVSVLAAESPDPQVGPVVAPPSPAAGSPTASGTGSPSSPTAPPSPTGTTAPTDPASAPQYVAPAPQPVDEDSDDGDDGDDGHGGDDRDDDGDDGDDDGDDD